MSESYTCNSSNKFDSMAMFFKFNEKCKCITNGQLNEDCCLLKKINKMSDKIRASTDDNVQNLWKYLIDKQVINEYHPHLKGKSFFFVFIFL